MITSADHLPRLGTSDHMCLVHELHVYTGVESTTNPKFRYHKGDYMSKNSELMKVNWPLMDDTNVEEAWSFFSEKFGAPMKHSQNQSNKGSLEETLNEQRSYVTPKTQTIGMAHVQIKQVLHRPHPNN